MNDLTKQEKNFKRVAINPALYEIYKEKAKSCHMPTSNYISKILENNLKNCNYTIKKQVEEMMHLNFQIQELIGLMEEKTIPESLYSSLNILIQEVKTYNGNL